MQHKETDPFYKSTPWEKVRAARLRRDGGWCQHCKRNKRPFIDASIVHHIKPRKTYPELALDINNLESLCPACHNKEHPEKSRARRLAKPQRRARVIKL